MEKRKDVKVFMLCDHKVDFLIDDDTITPLECGAAINDNNVCELKDNTGDNISDFNEFFLENTGVYWIWKNVKDAKYKGQTQYRRQFRGLSYLDFDKVFSQYDIIVADPLNLPKTFNHSTCTVEFHYKVAHNIRDLNILKEILEENYPQYMEDWDKYIINGKEMLYSCGFIMKSEDYDKYCSELFDILKLFLDRIEAKTIEDVSNYVSGCEKRNEYPNWTLHAGVSDEWKHKYQMRIGGSLAERFFTLYVFHNFKNIFYLPYDVKEDIKI